MSIDKQIGKQAEANTSVAPYEYKRSKDQEADTFISSRIDIENIAKRLKSKIFSVKTEELHSESSEEAESLLRSIARLVYELRERILDYDSIIGDDVGGRLLSLILYKLINKKREEQNKAKVPIYFVAAGRHVTIGGVQDEYGVDGPLKEIQITSVREFLEEKKDELGVKTLVSTDFIKTGHGMRWLLEILKELDVKYDVASVSVDVDFTTDENAHDVISGKLLYGNQGLEGSFLHVKSGQGVMKPILSWFLGKKAPHTERRSLSMKDANAGETKEGRREEVNFAREDVDLIVEELYKLLEP